LLWQTGAGFEVFRTPSRTFPLRDMEKGILWDREVGPGS